ncbi:flap endonuclease [Actinoalloteichus sp. AHMU CJ021]|uniref:5'-3' exonuclease n=1 Tax=Actinoalloteichus TaxID=65496 RepID=UPI000CA01C75|nr:flap endonuclease [Actinoalloteichus sp. AHMU CJ021]
MSGSRLVDGPLVLLDSASLWFRSFHALPESLTAPDGTPVNAVRGFTDTVARILTDRRPRRFVACLDADWRPAFRVEALPSYKTHRVAEGSSDAEEVPDTLAPQVEIILDVLAAAGLATSQSAGHEADDVIGTWAAGERADPVEIVTGDRDLFQLVRTEPTPTGVLYLGRGWAKAELFGPSEIAERYQLPVEIAGPAYEAMSVLRGDPSDGLPGVPGIGEKTAARLISTFGTVEELQAAAGAGDSRVPPRARAALVDAGDYLARATRVVRVVRDAPLLTDRDSAVPDSPSDPERLVELGRRWGLRRSVDRLAAALR